MPKKDPLHDGSIGSYVLRFILMFFIGLIADVVLALAIFIYGGWQIFIISWVAWPLFAAIPLTIAVLGIFYFDNITGIYDRYNEDYCDENL